MKRLALAGLGFLWGALIAWATVRTVSQIDWPSKAPSAGHCDDLEHCGTSLSFIAATLGFMLWPAVLFAAINAVAYRRWSSRQWGRVLMWVSAFVVLLYVAAYAIAPLVLPG